jgi:hypothetical protein
LSPATSIIGWEKRPKGRKKHRRKDLIYENYFSSPMGGKIEVPLEPS